RGLACAPVGLVSLALGPGCGDELGPRRRDPVGGPCWDAIDRIAPPFCDRCGAPMPMREPPESRERGSEGAIEAPFDDPEEGPPSSGVTSTYGGDVAEDGYARRAARSGAWTRREWIVV